MLLIPMNDDLSSDVLDFLMLWLCPVLYIHGYYLGRLSKAFLETLEIKLDI